MRVVLTAILIALSASSPRISQAHLFERPPGEKYDFFVCRAESGFPNLVEACAALGLFECNGKIEANGFLVSTKGKRNIIVTSSHSLIDEETNSLHEDCAFLPRGIPPKLPLRSAILLSPNVYELSQLPDLAAVQLMEPLPNITWRIPMESIVAKDLTSLFSSGTVRFAFLSIDPWRNKTLVSAYNCSPTPKIPGHLNYEDPNLLNHNCPTHKGYSGSPGMLFDTGSKRSVTLCVHSGDFGTDERRPFDPARNTNTCAAITPEFINMVNKWSLGESVEVPEGGVFIDYSTAPVQ